VVDKDNLPVSCKSGCAVPTDDIASVHRQLDVHILLIDSLRETAAQDQFSAL
jgi:hypothetical protein